MEIGFADIGGLLIIFFGLKVVVEGKIDIEAGVTNGAERNTKFIKSHKTRLTGNSAKATGVGFCILGMLMIWLVPNEEVIFTIPFL